MVGNKFFKKRNVKFGGKEEYYGKDTKHKDNWGEETIKGGHIGRYPTDILRYDVRKGTGGASTRPNELVDYMIKTYSNIGDHILDICCYDALTGKRAIQLQRNYTGIDLNPIL